MYLLALILLISIKSCQKTELILFVKAVKVYHTKSPFSQFESRWLEHRPHLNIKNWRKREREREREREEKERKKERKKVTGFKNGFCLLQMKILFTYSSFIVQLFNEKSISKSFSLWYFVGISRNTYSLLFGEAEIAQRQQVDGVNDIKEFTTLK